MEPTNARPVPRSDAERLKDDRLNEEFHALLQEAAEKREERQRVHSLQDEAAARQESHELLSLALAGGRRL